ncbi:FRIGIDA-like protein [Drosera capensis]
MGGNGNLEGEPSFMKSVDELWNLSAAMFNFKSKWDDLDKHIVFIEDPIEREERLAMTSMRSQAQQQEQNVASTSGADLSSSGVADAFDCDESLDADIVEVCDTTKQPDVSAVDASHLNKPSDTSAVKAPDHITPSNIDPVKISDPVKPSNIEAAKESDSNTDIKAMNASASGEPDQQKEVAEVDEKPNDDDTYTRSLHSEIENICRKMHGGDLRRYIRLHIPEYTKLRKEVPPALKLAPDPARLVLDSVGKFYRQGHKAFVKGSHENSARQASIFVMEFFLLMGGCDEMKPLVKEDAEAAAVAWRSRIIHEGGLSKACKMDARGLLLLVSCFGIPSVFTREDLVRLLRLSGSREIGEALRKSTALVPRIPDIVEHMKGNRLEVEAVDLVYMFRLEYKCSPMRILMSFRHKLKEECDEMKGSPALKIKATQKQLNGLRSVAECLEFHKVDPANHLPGWQLKDTITRLEKEVSDWAKRKQEDDDLSRSSENQASKRSRVTGDTSSTPSRSNGLQEAYPPPHLSGTGFSPSSLYPAAPIWHRDPAPAYYPVNPVGARLRAALQWDDVSAHPSLAPSSTLGYHRERFYGDHDSPIIRDGFFPDRPMVPSQSLYPNRSFLEQPSAGLPRRLSMGSSDLYQFADSVTERDNPSVGLSGSPGVRLPPSLYRSYLY